ncbi:MAG: SRPBCC family protein [Chitinophagales bacterium]|nr:SRPBCC family protein [Chitinophagales bacterium]MBP9705982.1 SRPBCC family protein [Chitinophagales bacterium]
MAKDMHIEKSIIINKPKSEIFDFLKLIKNQNQFSVWNMKDPNQQTTEQGTDGTVGYIYTWDSKDKNVGAGAQEIKAITPGEIIEYELRFERPMKNTAQSKFLFESVSENQTKVIWDFRGPTKFPMSLFKGLIAKMLGKDLAKSLENLKAKLELK